MDTIFCLTRIFLRSCGRAVRRIDLGRFALQQASLKTDKCNSQSLISNLQYFFSPDQAIHIVRGHITHTFYRPDLPALPS